MSDIGRAKSRVALAEKKHKKTQDAATAVSVRDARRELAEAKLTEYIERVVADAGPLTVDQKSRLSLLLQGEATS